jgi:hypothetical protein
MPELSLTCPHCETLKTAFRPLHVAPYRPGIPSALMFMQCQGCGGGIIAIVLDTAAKVQLWVKGADSPLADIVAVYPEVKEPKAPDDIPDNVRNAFLSGLDNLKLAYGANAAAMMFRRSVELSAKAINPDGKGNLKQRITDLSDDYVTPAMKEWAQHIRLDANDATHDEEEFSKEDAATLHVFAEMFLTYAFTLPAMLKRATGKP